MKNLGERIKQAIERIDAMQQELDRRLKELERGDHADYGTVRQVLQQLLDNKDTHTFLYNGSRLSIINTPQWFIEKGDEQGYTIELNAQVTDFYLTKERNGSFVWNIETNDPWYTPSGDEDIADDPFDYDPDYSPLIDKDAYTM